VTRAAPHVQLTSQACPRFVELVELGRTTDPELLEVATLYLTPLIEAKVDTVILGCTHYPLLTGVLSYVMGRGVVLVSSAEETARSVFARLVDSDLLAHAANASHQFISSGDPLTFARLAERFLGPRVTALDVEHAPLAALARR